MKQVKLSVLKGDITKVEVDAIVNAANSSLLGGGGVDGAIHKAGGPAILEECKQIIARQGGCPTGEAVITTAGNLPAKYVIHTVGPVWQGGSKQEEELLANCYYNSLRIAGEKNLQSIAFPNISTGVYGYPKDKAAEVAVAAVKSYLQQHPSSIKEVVFVCFDDENYELYSRLLDE
ncbi:O-acetyl-ADP-ribose deacetylase [Pontibacter ruber]|uniref:O-acetyl-ADP-ribose deacetylase n=1 Tax=Pontibacter ruber TaxID=1343895 RepID=A0ABW5CVV7_9BACT|nr:O-acetyl-ADP-ribose deacetylase [Pontibacter ruber]